MITVDMMCFAEKWDRDNEHGKTNTQGIFFEDKVKIKKKRLKIKLLTTYGVASIG
jgi:hypothetical protein